MQNACVAIVQIRDVPDEVQAELVRRARNAGQSLQQYVRNLLVRQAQRPEIAEFWRGVEERLRESAGSCSYSLSEAVEDVRAIRDDEER
jgi:hypothetical protein